MLDLQVCNQDPAGNCMGSINIPATTLALSYMTLVSKSFNFVEQMAYGTSDGYYIEAEQNNTLSLTTGDHHLVHFEQPQDSSIWTNTWDLESQMLLNTSNPRPYYSSYRWWYIESVSVFTKSNETDTKHYASRAYVYGTGSLGYQIVLHNASQTEVHLGVIPGSINSNTVSCSRKIN